MYNQKIISLCLLSVIFVACTGKPSSVTETNTLPILDKTWTAQGNEPSWRIIAKDKKIEISEPGKYDSSELIWEKRIDGDKTILTANARQLEMTFIEKMCEDTMSGQQFAYQVAIKWGKRQLKGCGQAN